MQPSPLTFPIVELDQVNLQLRSHAGLVSILQDIKLKIDKNETVALVGPSGSGKTSLLMLIAGLEAASSGHIRVCGHDITHMDEDELARFRADHIGIVFQSFHLIPTMTALENVRIPLEFSKKGNVDALAREALASLGLKNRLHHYPAQLSGGEQQRVAIARACVTQPALLLADEPTGNLDHHTGSQVMSLLFDLQKTTQSSLLLVTHDMTLAKSCNRIIQIADGKIVP